MMKRIHDYHAGMRYRMRRGYLPHALMVAVLGWPPEPPMYGYDVLPCGVPPFSVWRAMKFAVMRFFYMMRPFA